MSVENKMIVPDLEFEVLPAGACNVLHAPGLLVAFGLIALALL